MDHNPAYGWESGLSYVGTESSNVIIGSYGVIGDNNTIRIGNQGSGNNQQNRCFIAGIRGVTTTNADAVAVLIDSAGQLGTVSSSRRYKENIRPIENSSKILELEPVSFNYKKHPGTTSRGLIAEDVAQIFPELVIFKDDEPETIKYHDVAILLLDQVKVLSRRIGELESKIANL